MHAAAYNWVAQHTAEFARVIDFGGRDVNGSVRPLFGGADYHVVDLMPGPGVDEVADVAEWKTSRKADCIVCCEVLEHTDRADQIVKSAARALRAGGVLLLTAACDPRAPHSAADGGPLRPGEFYRNVEPDLLADWLKKAGLDAAIEVHRDRGDVYAVARKKG